ncbi:MAG: hypothetical protein AAFN41_05455 [Planctomycetota bacterium]
MGMARRTLMRVIGMNELALLEKQQQAMLSFPMDKSLWGYQHWYAVGRARGLIRLVINKAEQKHPEWVDGLIEQYAQTLAERQEDLQQLEFARLMWTEHAETSPANCIESLRLSMGNALNGTRLTTDRMLLLLEQCVIRLLAEDCATEADLVFVKRLQAYERGEIQTRLPPIELMNSRSAAVEAIDADHEPDWEGHPSLWQRFEAWVDQAEEARRQSEADEAAKREYERKQKAEAKATHRQRAIEARERGEETEDEKMIASIGIVTGVLIVIGAVITVVIVRS